MSGPREFRVHVRHHMQGVWRCDVELDGLLFAEGRALAPKENVVGIGEELACATGLPLVIDGDPPDVTPAMDDAGIAAPVNDNPLHSSQPIGTNPLDTETKTT